MSDATTVISALEARVAALEDEVRRLRNKKIGVRRTRLNWSDLQEKFYKQGLRDIMMCSCGAELPHQAVLREHWQLGHFDEAASAETPEEAIAVGFLVVDSSDGTAEFSAYLPSSKPKAVRWSRTCRPGDALVGECDDKVVVCLNVERIGA